MINDLKKCQCSMSISMLGDGCRYCQPQEYIDRLHEQIEDDEPIIDLHEHLIEMLTACVEVIENEDDDQKVLDNIVADGARQLLAKAKEYI